MPQDDPQPESLAKSKVPDLYQAALAETSKQRVEDMLKAQTELFQYLQELNQRWLARMQLEAAMASEFATKLAASRSFPETAAACQEWTNRRIELLAQDGQHLLADTMKVMEASARMLANGGTSSPEARA